MLDFVTSADLVAYGDAIAQMEHRVQQIEQGQANEQIWFLEHPAIITAGTSAKPSDLRSDRFEVFLSQRGGQYTYHGPGQLIAYTMLDLRHRGKDVRRFVRQLETVIIDALAQFDIKGERRDGRVGIWLSSDEMRRHGQIAQGESKIAAIGLRLRKWISFHGLSINLDPDLSHYDAIVPCGISAYGVTSFAALNKDVHRATLEAALKTSFQRVFSV